MTTLRTILGATALALAAGAAQAAPAGTLAAGIAADGTGVSAGAVTPAGWHVHRICRLRFGFHYHPFHGWHYGLHRRCFPFVHWVP